jgi:hypothetical protein
MEDGFELWFTDLTPEAQQELLAYAEAAAPEEMNWDVYPVAIIPC